MKKIPGIRLKDGILSFHFLTGCGVSFKKGGSIAWRWKAPGNSIGWEYVSPSELSEWIE